MEEAVGDHPTVFAKKYHRNAQKIKAIESVDRYDHLHPDRTQHWKKFFPCYRLMADMFQSTRQIK